MKRLPDGRLDLPYVSSWDDFCQGHLDPDQYFLAINLRAARVKSLHAHAGSRVLDEIRAFDSAEVEMNLGQINLVSVSSFCGPAGLVWGLDVARAIPPDTPPIGFRPQSSRGRSVPIFSAQPLVQASIRLFDQGNFPLAHGSIVHAACKCSYWSGNGWIYAAIGLGVPVDRQASAVFLMEDVGRLPNSRRNKSSGSGWLLDQVADSILETMSLQHVDCDRIYLTAMMRQVDDQSIGCSLVAAPYFRLARRGWPTGGLNRLRRMTLDDWLASVRKK